MEGGLELNIDAVVPILVFITTATWCVYYQDSFERRPIDSDPLMLIFHSNIVTWLTIDSAPTPLNDYLIKMERT